MSKALKITGYIFVSFIAVLLIFAFTFNLYFNKRLIKRIKEQVHISSQNSYSLSLDDLSINLLTRTITLRDLKIAPTQNKKSAKVQYVFKAKVLKIIDFSILSYFRKHDLLIERIEFEEPQISIFQGAERFPKQKDTIDAKFSLYQSFSKKINSIVIGNIDIMNSRFDIYKSGTDTISIFSTIDNTVSINNFVVNTETDKKKRLFVADKFEMVMNKFSYRMDDGLYTIHGKNLYTSYVDSTLVVDSLRIVPNYTKDKFADIAGKQISRLYMSTSKVNFIKMDVKLFFEYNWLVIKKIDISGCNIDVFRDNTLPFKKVVRPSIQTILKDLPFFVSIDTIEMKNGEAVFQVVNPGDDVSGKLTINKMNVLITGLHNDTLSYTDESKIKANFNAYLLNQGRFTENYTFPLKTNKELFHCTGSLSSMPLTSFNPMIKFSSFVKIKSGQLDSANFSFTANENSSSGTMKFLYHDLKVDVMNNNGDNIGVKDKLKTLLVNEFIIRDCNPGKDGVIRISKIEADHNPHKFFLFYSMQSILSGIEPAILGEKNAMMLKKNKTNK
jgi:hypothetical protein